MWFTDSKHEQVYTLLREKAQEEGKEYQAALYILAALQKPVEQFVSPHEIDFGTLLKAAGPWSSGEKALVKLAATLFNGFVWKFSLDNMFYCLDSGNFQIAMEALKIRYQM